MKDYLLLAFIPCGEIEMKWPELPSFLLCLCSVFNGIT